MVVLKDQVLRPHNEPNSGAQGRIGPTSGAQKNFPSPHADLPKLDELQCMVMHRRQKLKSQVFQSSRKVFYF